MTPGVSASGSAASTASSSCWESVAESGVPGLASAAAEVTPRSKSSTHDTDAAAGLTPHTDTSRAASNCTARAVTGPVVTDFANLGCPLFRLQTGIALAAGHATGARPHEDWW